MTGHATRTLYRPAGSSEVALIERTDYQGFPPRLPGQPIFYPVLNFEYAEQIARDWNSTDERHGFVGFVTRFQVLESFIEPYDVQQVGGRSHLEYWIPAGDLSRFNDAIVGRIDVVAEYRHGKRAA